MTDPDGRLVLGLDGGGTSTIVRLADSAGATLGEGRAGPSNQKAVGPDLARQAITDAIGSAFDSAGLARRAVDVACLGLAGFDRPEDRALLQSWASEGSWAERVVTANDAELVLAAGTPEGWGIALIAGTGSIAFGKAPDGQTARAGGWGPLLGDEGSAYAVAIAGLRLVARRADGRDGTAPDPDRLTAAALAATGAAEPADLIRILYKEGWDRPRIASLAPALIDGIDPEADPMAAKTLVLDPAAQLADAVDAVRDRLWLNDRPVTLALAGSFLLLCRPLRLAVGRNFEDSTVTLVDVPAPVAGAVILARRALP
jgi:N-acetylglucosamine kinase-like BadF-type ATPase